MSLVVLSGRVAAFFLVSLGGCLLSCLAGWLRPCLISAGGCRLVSPWWVAAALFRLGGWLRPSYFLGGLLRFILSRWIVAALSHGCSLVLSRRVAASFFLSWWVATVYLVSVGCCGIVSWLQPHAVSEGGCGFLYV
jgi:hypothetical protein